jgi:hypothetical protein
MKADVYWHSRRRMWSLRIDGRVADHLPTLALQRCRMVVREAERQRCISRRQRGVHAWIQGSLITSPEISEAFVEVGYSPFVCGSFTTRPGFLPIWEAAIVTFDKDGKAWALVSDHAQLETAS